MTTTSPHTVALPDPYATVPPSVVLPDPRTDAARRDVGPLRYHRLARTLTGWWRPVVMLLVAALAWAGMVLLLLVATMVAGTADPRLGHALDRWLNSPDLPDDDPLGLALMLGMLALGVPACRLAARLAGRRGGLDSVAGRVRWGLLARALVAPAVVMLVFLGVGFLVDPQSVHLSHGAGWLAVVIVLLVPLQAAGEEYAFRGLLPQVVGSWLRSPVWGAVVSVPLFLAGHEYNALGLASIGVYAAAASWAVWRTGGLEVAIAWHAVNNLVAFGTELLGLSDPDAAVTLASAATDIASTVLVVAVVEWQWRTRWSHRYAATGTGREADEPLPISA